MSIEQREADYREWAARNARDPEEGTTARAYEEHLAGQPIEEWWDEMDADAAEQAFWDDDPRRLR